MSVVRNNRQPTQPPGRRRPDFTPSKSKSLFLRIDCRAGRARVVGHESGDLYSRKAVFNIDLENLKSGWLDFNANAESAIVGDDRENPPPGAGDRNGPKWGIEVPVAMPYETTFDGVDIKKIDPCLIRTTTALLLEAFATLWDAYVEAKHDAGDVVCVEIAGWESVTKGGGKKYFRPRFKILGFVKGLEDPLDSVVAD